MWLFGKITEKTLWIKTVYDSKSLEELYAWLRTEWSETDRFSYWRLWWRSRNGLAWGSWEGYWQLLLVYSKFYRCLWVHKHLSDTTAFLRQTMTLKILSCKQCWFKRWWMSSLGSQGGGCHGQLGMAWLCSDLHLQNGTRQIQPNTRSHLWI